AGDVAVRNAVAQDDHPARLVRLLGQRVLDERAPDGSRDYHQTVFSIDCSTSEVSQKSAERYFQPASARTQTTTPSSSSSAASLRATWTTAPAETPPKMPSKSSSACSPATDSAFETSTFRSSFVMSRIGGT